MFRNLGNRFYWWFSNTFVTPDEEMDEIFDLICPENSEELSIGWHQWSVGRSMSLVALVVLAISLAMIITGALFDVAIMQTIGLIVGGLSVLANVAVSGVAGSGKDKYYYEDGVCTGQFNSKRPRNRVVEQGVYRR